jgi:hypothetical protein
MVPGRVLMIGGFWQCFSHSAARAKCAGVGGGNRRHSEQV